MGSKVFYFTFIVYFIASSFILVSFVLKAKENIPPDVPNVVVEDKVRPEEGGEGFEGKDWDTDTESQPFADPKAIKGGTLRLRIPIFPSTLRFVGKDTNTRMNSILQSMVYETLLKLHPGTMDYISSLATHWQILRDQKTFRFRLNPKARWPDGTPITTDDIIASWQLRIDPGIESPDTNKVFQRLKKPVAESKYIFHVDAKDLDWQLFLNLVRMHIYPAHILKNLDGKAYMEQYNDKIIPGSGPYHIPSALIEPGKKIVLVRRNDYWASSEKFVKNCYNFDRIELLVEPDSEKSFENFKKNEYDVYGVNVAAQWVKGSDFDEVKRGLVQKRKIFNKAPQGFSGFAFNLRNPPLDDIKVRKALVFLFDREKLIEKFFMGEYIPLDSYYPGSIYSNPKNSKYRFDPEQSLDLLKEAGWERKTPKDPFTKDGKPLEISLLCSVSVIPVLKAYQEDAEKTGIKLKLEPEPKILQRIMSRQFQMAMISWAGEHFPDPDSWDSSMADQPNSQNICGVKLPKVDKICQMYRKMFLPRQRADALRKLDRMLLNYHPYALGWGKNYERILYWNKFGFPSGYLSKTGDFWDILYLWWVDETRSRNLQQAMANKQIQLPVGATDERYWLEQN